MLFDSQAAKAARVALPSAEFIQRLLLSRIMYRDEEVMEAARKAYAHDFIVPMAEGYHSLVGERGFLPQEAAQSSKV